MPKCLFKSIFPNPAELAYLLAFQLRIKMIRGFILTALFVVGSTVAKPSPQEGALDQLERVSAGGYDNAAADVDQSVLDELFGGGGGGGNEINDGYKPPPPENQVWDPTFNSLI